MIPFFELHAIPVGPLKIQVWGLFVAVGMVAAIWLGSREAKRRGLSADAFIDFSSVIMLCAFVGARIFHILAYAPAAYLADPFKVFRVWEGGLSSIGGFLGAFVGAMLFARTRKVSFRAYGDVACYALPLGYALGRVGCFLIHDHPGTLSSSLLAVNFPGGPRLDHGLLLAILGFAIFTAFVALNRRKPAAIGRENGYLPLFMVSYGSVRFVLDFFRATDIAGADARFGGLTPAQYVCLALVAGGLLLLKTGAYRSSKQLAVSN